MSSTHRPGRSRENGAEVGQWAASFAEFGPDAIVPSQYYDARHPGVCSDGEHRLMLAVLKTAISDYLCATGPQNRQGRRRSDEVDAWIGNQCPASGVFAFEEVCESLGIDPDRLRKWLWSLKGRAVVPRMRSQLVLLPANRPTHAARRGR